MPHRSLRSRLLNETGRQRATGAGLQSAAALAALTRVAMGLLQLVQPMEEEEEEEDCGGGDKDDFLALKDGETARRLIYKPHRLSCYGIFLNDVMQHGMQLCPARGCRGYSSGDMRTSPPA